MDETIMSVQLTVLEALDTAGDSRVGADAE